MCSEFPYEFIIQGITMEKRNKKIITIAAIIIAVIAAAIIGTVAIQATPANRLKRQLRLAQKYLNELNYEQAVLAYREAIAIDPKCEQAYFAIADIYIKTNEEDKAVAILEQAQANIQTASLTAKLDEVRKQAAAAKEVRGEGGSTGQNNNQVTAPTQAQPTTAASTQSASQAQPTTEASTAAWTETAIEVLTEAPTETPTEAQPEPQVPASVIAPANAGDIITFGTYEQDNNTGNGAEPIEWLVLDNQGDRMLVISRYGLDCRPYNEADIQEVTWEICTLRSWLNSEFYNTAFNDSEKASIRTTTLNNPDSLYGSGGNATNDKVFCLSTEEAKAYFGADDSKEQNPARATKPTVYAVARGATEFGGNCWWWLRSPGYFLDDVARVIEDGYIYEGGLDIGYIYSAVRPAIWIGL